MAQNTRQSIPRFSPQIQTPTQLQLPSGPHPSAFESESQSHVCLNHQWQHSRTRSPSWQPTPELQSCQSHPYLWHRPNAAFMDPLRNKITETGLEGKYTLINCGIKDVEILREYGIVEGSTDCVVSMQVICSVEKPEKAVKGVGGC